MAKGAGPGPANRHWLGVRAGRIPLVLVPVASLADSVHEGMAREAVTYCPECAEQEFGEGTTGGKDS